MAQNVTVAGASFSDVPSVVLPKTGGGTASFTDVTDTTAAAADVASGKYFYTAAGVRTQGTASGGGGGGLVYETGTWTPASDISEHTISFTNAHSSLPINVIVSDIGSGVATTNSNLYFALSNWYELSGYPVMQTSNTSQYALIRFGYKSSSGIGSGGQNIQYATGDSGVSYMNYWLTSSWAKVSTNSTTHFWRAGRTYKWIAVWAPSS